MTARNLIIFCVGAVLVVLVLVGCDSAGMSTPVVYVATPSTGSSTPDLHSINAPMQRNRSYPPPSALNAPIYPGATHIISDTASTVNVKYYEFQTYNKPNAILQYYKDVLIKDGWEERDMPSGWAAHAASFRWRHPNGTVFYSLLLDAPIRSTDNITHVTIKLEVEPGGM